MTLLLAQVAERDAKLVNTALWLWIAFAIVAIVLVGGAWVIISRQRRMLLRGKSLRKRKPIRDAWAESARRLQVEDEPDANPDGEDER
ncbi:MAG: hypothetical protein WEC33_04650 [Dehalococcoidia bacterium]